MQRFESILLSKRCGLESSSTQYAFPRDGFFSLIVRSGDFSLHFFPFSAFLALFDDPAPRCTLLIWINSPVQSTRAAGVQSLGETVRVMIDSTEIVGQWSLLYVVGDNVMIASCVTYPWSKIAASFKGRYHTQSSKK